MWVVAYFYWSEYLIDSVEEVSPGSNELLWSTLRHGNEVIYKNVYCLQPLW